VRRVIAFVAVCIVLAVPASASGLRSSTAAVAGPQPIIDLDFPHTSGPSVPDRSGSGNAGAGKKGPVGSETSWSPTTTTDAQGATAVVFAGRQKQRIEIPNRMRGLDVNHFSILVRFTLNESVDTDPAHQRYELMEKAGSFWFNVREDTTPRYRLRVGGFFNGHSADTFTGAVLHRQYHAPATTLTDTDGQPFSLASSTDKRLRKSACASAMERHSLVRKPLP